MAGSSELIFQFEKNSKKVLNKNEFSDPLNAFDIGAYDLGLGRFVSMLEGPDEEQNCGHQANQERSSSIQKPDQTQGEHCADYDSFAYNPFPFNVLDLRKNLFEEGGNDRTLIEHRPVRIMDTAQGTDGRVRIHFGRAGRSVTYLDELSELNDTENGVGSVAGRNGPFSAQGKNHNKFNLGRFYTKFDQAFADGLLSICMKKYQQKESKS
ncbi:hypothetical protein YC2023_009255 [Brassica napus]